jgi:hypothetical protein
MKMSLFYRYAVFLFLSLTLISCNNSEKKKLDTSEDVKHLDIAQIYSIDTSEIEIQWTAYKFTNKVGVRGIFTQYVFSSESESGTIEDLLEKSKIAIKAQSVSTGDSIRDPKLRNIFFKIFNTDTINGEILEAKSGTGNLTLEMNKLKQEIPYTYYLTQDTIILKTALDLTKWKGDEALQALNKECYDLHKGTDGISKLWPDVDVLIKLPVKNMQTIN